jgi:hypothetical protein
MEPRTRNADQAFGYSQVCIIMGAAIPPEAQKHYTAFFEKLFKAEFGVRVQYLETILTKPDLDEDGNPVPETGGRSDIFFAIHDDDVLSFSTSRLKLSAYGFTPRWVEDVLSPDNGNRHLYPKRVQNYCL